MSTQQLQRLQAAAIDGRAHNVYFRQTQLERLCKALLLEESALRDAMISDSNYSPAEAIAVLHASVQAVKDAYTKLQPSQALEKEYRIAHGHDAPDAGTPFGLVYIEPEAHTLLYSVCSPLSSAIVAGNCVIVLLENTLRQLPALIRKILTEALDADSFAIVSSPVKDHETLNNALGIRRADDPSWPRTNELLSPSDSAAIAVVDRTADVGLAASELVQAKLAFDGRSPYAPELVLVNEFVMEGFIQATLTASGASSASVPDQTMARNEKTAARSLAMDLPKGTVTTTASGIGLHQILKAKSKTSGLILHPIRSLDDAINLLDGHQAKPFLSAYHFSDFKSAKYLSQFVDAEVTFINQIPRQILMGPAAPKGHPCNPHNRYPVSLFSQSRPAFVQTLPTNRELAAVLASRDNVSAQKLLQEAKQPLQAMKRSEGGGVGFFEQGILINASFILFSIVALSATGGWQLWKYRSSR